MAGRPDPAAESGGEEREVLLQRAQRLEALGRLSSSLSHDLSNYLTSIMLNADALARALGAASPLAARARDILAAASQANSALKRLSAFRRREDGGPRAVELNNALIELEEVLARAIHEDVQLVVRLDPRLARIWIDPGRLEQLVVHLVMNARDAMAEGGELVIATSRRPSPVPEAADRVVLTVRDNGCGMDEATRERIFDPLFTTKRDSRGTGLGLAAVIEIATEAGGRIEVESEPGRGSAFHVVFPPFEARQPSGAESASILLVEDENLLRELLAGALEGAGHRVRAAARAAQALDILATAPECVDLLVTDVMLPGMRGTELGRQVGERWPRIRLLYISGDVDDPALRAYLRSTPAELLWKPFDTDTLLRKIAAVLAADV